MGQLGYGQTLKTTGKNFGDLMQPASVTRVIGDKKSPMTDSQRLIGLRHAGYAMQPVPIVRPVEEILKYVEKEVIIENIKHVEKVEIMEITREIPVKRIEYVEKVVEVEEIKWIEVERDVVHIKEIIKELPERIEDNEIIIEEPYVEVIDVLQEYEEIEYIDKIVEIEVPTKFEKIYEVEMEEEVIRERIKHVHVPQIEVVEDIHEIYIPEYEDEPYDVIKYVETEVEVIVERDVEVKKQVDIPVYQHIHIPIIIDEIIKTPKKIVEREIEYPTYVDKIVDKDVYYPRIDRVNTHHPVDLHTWTTERVHGPYQLGTHSLLMNDIRYHQNNNIIPVNT
eukprot:GHVR01131938.1.p1 GENE.GHVR01131938.1~~GHVR01131938.1.p1  ORF type:complete len:337 (+),score=89.78 GHVR01131938.1:320-1330(+)